MIIRKHLPEGLKQAALSLGLAAVFAVTYCFAAPVPHKLTAVILPVALFVFFFAFLTLPVLRNLTDRVYFLLLDPETRSVWVEICYTCIAGFLMLHHVYVTMHYSVPPWGATEFGTAWCWFALATVFLGRLWQDRGALLLLALLALQSLRLILGEADAFWHGRDILRNVIYAGFLCYGAGRVLRPRIRDVFVKGFCGLWALACLIFSVMGIYTAWTGISISNGISSTYVYRGRLYIFYYCMQAGIIASCGAIICLLFMTAMRKKSVWILGALMMIIMMIANALTGTRVGYVMTALAVGLTVCVPLSDRFIGGLGRLEFRKGLLLLCVLVLVVAALTLAQNGITPAFNALREKGSVLLPGALAEEAAVTTEKIYRNVKTSTLNQLLTGRVTIWTDAVNYLLKDPSRLLVGESVFEPVAGLNAYARGLGRKQMVDHCHSICLQTVMESGIPGLLLLLALFWHFLRSAIRVITNRKLPLWKRLISMPALIILVCDTLESSSSIQFAFPSMTLLYLFMGLTIAVDRTEGKGREIRP